MNLVVSRAGSWAAPKDCHLVDWWVSLLAGLWAGHLAAARAYHWADPWAFLLVDLKVGCLAYW